MTRIIKFRAWANGKMEYDFRVIPNTEKVGVNDFFGAYYLGEEIIWMQFMWLRG